MEICLVQEEMEKLRFLYFQFKFLNKILLAKDLIFLISWNFLDLECRLEIEKGVEYS